MDRNGVPTSDTGCAPWHGRSDRSRWPGRPHRSGWRYDLVLTAVVAVVQVGGTALATRHQTGVRALDLLGYLLLAAGPATLLGRRRWPVAALYVAFAVTFAYAALGYPGGPLWLPLIITFATVLTTGHRVAAYGSLALGYLGFVWLAPWAAGRSLPSPSAAVGIAAWMLLLAAGSELLRNRRAYLSAARERFIEQQRYREQEARRQVSEQRLGIARELHDVLAHSLAMINVQAGVALELIDRRPEQVRPALDAIKHASKEALVEVQAVLTTLREPDEQAPRVPAASLANLDELVGRAAAAGLDVRTDISGSMTPLPESVDLAAYRVVQEGLTNVVRHADARTVTIAVHRVPGELTVEVHDDGRAPASAARVAAGNGLTGMRERITALGGRLEAGPGASGGFLVRACLPVPAVEEG